MITEDLIGYDTALLAKEKGFDELCNHYIWSDSESKQPLDVVRSSNKGRPCKQEQWEDEEKGKRVFTISVPTQSLLVKWLREKHKIDVAIIPGGHTYMAQIIDKNKKEGFRTVKVEDVKIFKSYEQALEHALFEALKLIK